MAITGEIKATELRSFVVARFDTPEILATKLTAFALVNFPTSEIQATMLRSMGVVRGNHEIDVTKLAALVVCKGRVSQPHVKVWTFTLDGHDFYVLQLPTETLVYDLSTEQWHCWGSFNSTTWRAVHGIDWKANIGATQAALGGQNISSVIVGDDTTAAVYFLAPEKAEDDYTDTERVGTSYTFERVIHAQIVLRGRDFMPLNGVILTGSVGDIDDASVLTVNLKYSDDRGHTYTSAGDVDIVSGTYDTRVEWRSLGSVRQPGRLMKITDYGALTRIDGLDIPDADEH